MTKINKTRESVSAISRQLNISPLSGLDFDEFPQQEDSLNVFFLSFNFCIHTYIFCKSINIFLSINIESQRCTI